MEHEFIGGYETSKGNPITQFLWWCAGGDPILLNKGTYTDQVKLACMGGTVLATAILAFFAGAYAINSIFSETPNSDISIMEWGFGLLWGLIIFNIDRFIVSSTQPKVKEMSFWGAIKPAIPRIIMGVVISLIISKPLELKIFEKDIELAIAKTKEEKFLEIKDATRKKYKNEESLLESKIAKFDKEIFDLEKQRNEYDSLFQVEARIVTVGPRAKAMEKGRDDAIARIENIKISSEYQALQKEKDVLFNKINKNAEIERKNVDLGMRSLVNKIKLSHEISPVISNMITLLFIILELTPIIFKLLMEKSPIDYLQYNRNEIIKAKYLIEEEKDDDIKVNSIVAENILERLKIEHELFHNRLLKEFEEDNKKKEEHNLAINETKNQNYLNANIEFVDIKKDKRIKENQNQYLENKKENEKYINAVNVKQEIEDDKLQKFKINEIALNELTIGEYKNKESQSIAANPVEAFYERFPYYPQRQDEENNELINDELIKDKKWTKGEPFAYVRIFTKEDLRSHLSIIEDKIEEAFNDEANTVLTSDKISQSKKNINLKDWAYKNDNMSKYKIDEDMLSDVIKRAEINLKEKFA